MNKLHFFNKLEKDLKYLEINNIDEIIRDYEEYFLEQEKKTALSGFCRTLISWDKCTNFIIIISN